MSGSDFLLNLGALYVAITSIKAFGHLHWESNSLPVKSMVILKISMPSQ